MSAPKKNSSLSALFFVYGGIALFGGVLHFIGLIIQSNFYVGRNILYWLYQAAGMFQLSITSATAVWLFTSFGACMYCLMQQDIRREYSRKFWRNLFWLVIFGGIVYSAYEIYQMMFPEYHDYPWRDILLAWFATGTLLIPLLFLPPKLQD